MKQIDILKVFALEFGTKDLLQTNKILKAKAKDKIKFKLMGESIGYLGLTVVIKAVTADGLKIFDTNRVRLIRFDDIETFEKAKPKVARPVYDKPKPIKKAKSSVKKQKKFEDDGDDISMDFDDLADDDGEDLDDDFDQPVKRRRKERTYIPKK